MSREAIAAVLARTDLASGERLVALSLASFAGRENRAWPGAPAASARAGLSRSRYQQAREQLVARGLVAVDERATGRGRASTVTLLFADAGPWWDGDINVELFEAVLSYSRARGPERLLLGDDGRARRRATAPCATSRPSSCAPRPGSRTGRTGARALRCSRRAELELVSGAGGRGNTNVWSVRDPREIGDALRRPNAAARRAAGRRAAAGGLGGFTCTRRNRRRRPTKRAVRIGHLPPKTVRS